VSASAQDRSGAENLEAQCCRLLISLERWIDAALELAQKIETKEHRHESGTAMKADPLIRQGEPFPPEASYPAVTSSSRSGCFRLEQQLPGGLSSSHWKSAFFSRRARILG
jgi:hypothetical protein